MNISAATQESSLIIDKNPRSKLGLDASCRSSVEIVSKKQSGHQIPSDRAGSLIEQSEVPRNGW